MSISFKKINNMISQEVDSISDLSDKQKQILRETCEKIYMLESSVELSNQQLVLDLKGEVTRRADGFIEAGT